MDPLTASLILAGGKAALGGYQAYKGKKLADQTQRPYYEIPEAVKEQLKLAKAQSIGTRLPGQSAIEENIEGSGESAIRAAQESANNPAALMATISAINANKNQSLQQLGVQGAQMQQQNQANLQNVLGNVAQEQKAQFMYNKDEPYRNTAAAAEALKGAGIQNIQSGLMDAGGIAAKAYSNQNLEGLLGKKGSGAAGTNSALNTNKNILQSLGIDTTSMSDEDVVSLINSLGLV